MSQITPFVKRMRVKGGTIYTFSSASEDIGLNINTKNNTVEMSHYALLKIPDIANVKGDLQQNRFNPLFIPGAYEDYINSNSSIKDGRVLIAESFQNYALNLETALISRSKYDANFKHTVSERVFWKWLKETGAIRWKNHGDYWQEEDESENGYSHVVKGYGRIDAGAMKSSTFGTFNETYVLVPTSYGKMPTFFKQIEDSNYSHGMKISNGPDAILGRETYSHVHPDGLSINAFYDIGKSDTSIGDDLFQYANGDDIWANGWWWNTADETITPGIKNAYFTDSSTYKTTGINNIDLRYRASDIKSRRSKVDCICMEFEEDKLATLLGESALTYDDIGINHSSATEFDFNAVLLYYSIYHENTLLATNLFGVMFLDPATGNTSNYPDTEIVLPTITKIKSTVDGFGTSYSFRVNILSDYMSDGLNPIVDNTSGSQTTLDTFGDVLKGLTKTINILSHNTQLSQHISDKYTDTMDKISSLESQIDDLRKDIASDNELKIGNWNIVKDASSLVFRFMNDTKLILDSDGNIQISGTTSENEVFE